MGRIDLSANLDPSRTATVETLVLVRKMGTHDHDHQPERDPERTKADPVEAWENARVWKWSASELKVRWTYGSNTIAEKYDYTKIWIETLRSMQKRKGGWEEQN
jgi:hypothetical protein